MLRELNKGKLVRAYSKPDLDNDIKRQEGIAKKINWQNFMLRKVDKSRDGSLSFFHLDAFDGNNYKAKIMDMKRYIKEKHGNWLNKECALLDIKKTKNAVYQDTRVELDIKETVNDVHAGIYGLADLDENMQNKVALSIYQSCIKFCVMNKLKDVSSNLLGRFFNKK